MVYLQGVLATFTRKLHIQMQQLGLSVNRLALLSGVDQSLLNKIATGRRAPTQEVLRRIWPHLGITLGELQAWADADRLGADRMQSLDRFVLHEHAPTKWQDARQRLLASFERLPLALREQAIAYLDRLAQAQDDREGEDDQQDEA